jgi:hypothetical protein
MTVRMQIAANNGERLTVSTQGDDADSVMLRLCDEVALAMPAELKKLSAKAVPALLATLVDVYLGKKVSTNTCGLVSGGSACAQLFAESPDEKSTLPFVGAVQAMVGEKMHPEPKLDPSTPTVTLPFAKVHRDSAWMLPTTLVKSQLTSTQLREI